MHYIAPIISIHDYVMHPRLSSRVLNATARLATGTRKFDHGLSHLLHEELHWLDVPERIHYKLGVTVHHCLQYTRLLSTWSTAVHQSQTFPADVIYGQPLDIT